MTQRTVEVESSGSVARIWMNRPEVHNACNEHLIEQLSDAFTDLERQDLRVIVLAGRGPSFCAGADVQWMKQQGMASPEANLEDARALARLFSVIANSSKPTIARVHGKALGAGVGMVAACDIAIGSTDASLGLPEVRLGLVPATISPYVLRAIGERHARRFFQTGERIDALTAEKVGLLHQVVSPHDLDQQVDRTISDLLAGGPSAQRTVKHLIDTVAHRAISAELVEETAQSIASCRAGAEAKEGLSAFLEKRPAAWVTR